MDSFIKNVSVLSLLLFISSTAETLEYQSWSQRVLQCPNIEVLFLKACQGSTEAQIDPWAPGWLIFPSNI